MIIFSCVIALQLLSTPLSAQTTVTTDFANPCTGGTTSFSLTLNAAGDTFTWSGLGQSRSWSVYDQNYGMESGEWILGVMGYPDCLGGGGGGNGGVDTTGGSGFGDAVVPYDPVVTQSVQSFKAVVFSERAQPRAAGKREKKTQQAREEQQREEGGTPGQAPPRLYGMANSDVEQEWFSLSSLDGTNLAIRGGYAKTADDGVDTYGGNLILNRLSFDRGGSSTSSTINLYGNRILLETEDMERTVGASANLLMFHDDTGIALAAYGVERKYDGDKIIVYGGMFQYSKVGDLSSGYLMAAGMYGFPLANPKYSLNIDGLFIRNLFTSYDGSSVDLDSRSILDLGVNLSIYMSETFGLTVGAKKVFLVKDYSNFVLTLGGGFRF